MSAVEKKPNGGTLKNSSAGNAYNESGTCIVAKAEQALCLLL